MAHVIDTLVVELGLDPKKFTDAQKRSLDDFKRGQEEFRKRGREIEDQGRKLDDAFASLKRGALSLGAAFLGITGAKQFLDYLTTADAAAGRAAKTLNMGVRELSAWQGAAKATGGSAEGITGALQGLSGAMNQFILTGNGPFLGIMNHLGLSLFDNNKKLKTAGQMMLEISDAVYKINASDPARAAATLSMIPGMNQDSINLMIQGRNVLQQLLDEQMRAGGATEKSAEAAAEYQRQLANLQRSAEDTGRTILQSLIPSLISFMDTVKTMFTNPIWDSKKGFWENLFGKAEDWKNPIVPGGFADRLFKLGKADYKGFGGMMDYLAGAGYDPAKENATKKLAGGLTRQAGTFAEQEAYIREAAAKRGIDPNIAIQVARSEGINGYVVGNNQQSSVVKNGRREESYGPFQLYMGGGLGNKMLSQTGLDPRDPTTWKQQIDFALDHAGKAGWGSWYGWKGSPRAGIGLPPSGPRMSAISNDNRRGGDQTTSNDASVTIGTLNVNAPNAKDAGGIAAELPDAIKRQNWAASANYGLQ